MPNTDPKVNFLNHLPFYFKKALDAENWELQNGMINDRNAFGRLTVAIKDTLKEVEAHVGTDFPVQAAELRERYKAINTHDEDTKEVNRRLNEVNIAFMQLMDSFKPGFSTSYIKAIGANDIGIALDFANQAKATEVSRQATIQEQRASKQTPKKKGFFGSLFD